MQEKEKSRKTSKLTDVERRLLKEAKKLLKKRQRELDAPSTDSGSDAAEEALLPASTVVCLSRQRIAQLSTWNGLLVKPC